MKKENEPAKEGPGKWTNGGIEQKRRPAWISDAHSNSLL